MPQGLARMFLLTISSVFSPSASLIHSADSRSLQPAERQTVSGLLYFLFEEQCSMPLIKRLALLSIKIHLILLFTHKGTL
jgi:hypothetical protein